MNINTINICTIISLGFAIRSIVSLYPYSGKGIKPMYGDYEAQRHWQEITINLPISEWYMNTSRNDLMYWGLDYPPLTAYHSWLLGKIAYNYLDKKFVEFENSRGYESITHKYFMRITVLLMDLLIYIPAVYLAVMSIMKFNKNTFSKKLQFIPKIDHLMIFLLYPGQILIDNGHFQYNNVSLGLTLLGIICIIQDKNILGSIMFCLALNYKQMELYHSLPFFVYLLRINVMNKKSFASNLISLIKIGLAVILTFGVLWLPWIITMDVPAVVHRIFPLARGVFEDKVSNFWCILNIFIKIKQIFSNESMAIICIFSTLLAVLPSCLHLFLYPDKLTFIYSLFNCSLSFFIFSYQVHEKSILLPVLPALLLFPVDPYAVSWFLQISTFSMLPLLVKDGLTVSWLACSMIFYFICDIIVKENTTEKNKFAKTQKLALHLSYVIGIILAVCHLFAPIPARLPHIYPVLISLYSFLHFLLFNLYFNYKQLCRR